MIIDCIVKQPKTQKAHTGEIGFYVYGQRYYWCNCDNDLESTLIKIEKDGRPCLIMRNPDNTKTIDWMVF